MKDLTYCQDMKCPKRLTCFRYMQNNVNCKPIRYSIFTESPLNIKDKTCEFYIDKRLNECKHINR